ncbi:or S-antigen, C-terminal domain-domain-containing protein [Clohesyomyces aquaticus]|uniref:Or S-antigen, C-terminal domain-domain-containing protein n=1 Tax=Clohesyomyces aquaticus TaxID=1231657 RepID=A0A1Y1ZYD8_9PLEO|nr:or S-antigen, C-terminal domain-domain-containing protein [Clohesyomyces aquaticus]
MTDYLHVYTDRGRLSYLPDHLPDPLRVRRGPFQARGRRPHRIHTAHVAPDPSLFPRRRQTSSRSYITEKLAGPRDNAKRFLRSFIDTHFTQPDRHSTESTSPRSSLSSARAYLASPPDSRRWSWATSEMRTSPRNSMIGGSLAPRPALADGHRSGSSRSSAKSLASSAIRTLPEDKPLASGNGINVGISLTEPVLFLQGFEQTEHSDRSTAMLRGRLTLKVTKPSKVKAITLKFRGKATTKWPEGIPPKKIEFEETDTIMSHTWPFFNAQFSNSEAGSGADHVELYKSATASVASQGGLFSRSPNASSTNLTTKEAKRLSLQVNQSRSFGKGESSTNGPSVAQKGYRTFNPGEYSYNFELPLDSHLPETIDVELGSVKYELEAIIERAGAFRANLVGTKEVTLIRAPSEGSLEQVEPIAISRSWEDQLHYDIVISGKSFPLGAQVPIAFKLTPLAKVQCHRIKVFVTENVEYFCANKRVHRMEPVRKVQLFEKRADGPPTSTFPGSTMRIVSGGGVPYDQRAAAASGQNVEVQDPTNLLGNLSGEVNIGPTEMEFNVQLPSCHNMKEKDKLSRLHFDTTYQNIQVHHWIKIVMRLSKPDQNDPSKRRHFEISIDSPFHILSCQATQANTSLPAYSSPESTPHEARMPECGCPGAPIRRTSPTSFVPTLSALGRARDNSTDSIPSPNLARPQQAHIGGPNDAAVQRPIHLLRAPSFNPPAFEDEEPPPPMETPPPLYESIASPTNGLADYFSRLSDAYDDDSEGEMGGSSRSSRSRVEIPLTPGSRVNSRSMDERRTWLPVGH